MQRDLVFESNQFNLSKELPYFINPCCFGEDLAAWIGEQLRAQGISATAPAQEDWGWYFFTQVDETPYFIGVGGFSNENPADLNQGEWRITIEKERTLWQKLTRKNELSRNERIFDVIENLIVQKLGITTARYKEVQ